MKSATPIPTLEDALGLKLHFVGRREDEVGLLESFARLAVADYADRTRLSAKLRRFQREVGLDHNIAAAFVTVLADALGFVDRRSEAVLVLEGFAGLAADDYADPVTLGDKLRQFQHNRQITGTNSAIYVGRLAEALGDIGRRSEAVRVVEGFAGLSEADYGDINTLGRKLRQFRADMQLEGNNAANYVRRLADALVFVNRPDHARHALQEFAGLAQADYTDRPGLGAKLRRFRRELELEGNNAVLYVVDLADALGDVGRNEHAAWSLDEFAGLAEADYNDAHTLSRKLRRFQNELQLGGNNAAIFLRALARALDGVDRHEEAVRALEGFAGLAADDYADPAILGDKLRQFQCDLQLTKNNTCTYLLTMAGALGDVGRRREAVLVLEAFAGLSEADYRDPYTLGRKLRRFQNELHLFGNNVAGYLLALANMLRSISPEKAVRALEGFAGLAADDYTDPVTLGDKLRQFEHDLQLTKDKICAYIAILADTLRICGPQTLAGTPGALGRRDDSVKLLIAHDPQFQFLDDPQMTVTAQNGCALMALLFDLIGADAVWLPFLWDLCLHVVPYALRGLQLPRVTPEDRRRYVERVAQLREQVVQIGWQAAEVENVASEAEAKRRLALRWDVELGQRLLLEQFLVGRMERIGHDGAAEPVNAFPYPSQRPRYWTRTWPPHWCGYRPPRGVTDPINNLAFVSRPSPEEPPAGLDAATFIDRPQWIEGIDAEVLRGVDEATLAGALGAGTLLLRAGFHRDGRLHWSAWCSDGQHLELSGHGGGKTGNDRERLAWAVARHDLRIALGYVMGKDDQVKDRREQARKIIETKGDLAGTLTLGGVEDARGRLHVLTERLWEVGFAGLAIQLARSVGPLIDPPQDAQQLPRWAKQFSASWSQLRQDLATLPKAFPLAMNWATDQFLEELHGIWRFDELAKVLTADLDVVVQVDDVLHGVPIPHLPVAGRPLWACVRSTRNSLSPLMDLVQARIERDSPPQPLTSNRLQCISWFEPADAAGQGAVELHHGQEQLARQYGLSYHGAAVSPAGRTTTLFKGVAAGPLIALTACGHGVDERSAVHLADMDWQGGGGDLSGVEWLLLPTCSIGRVRSTGVRDVEGFSVRLAVHRCRAVLAARWPVQCQMAPETANEVLAQYLRLRQEFDAGQQGRDLTQARLRARALNAARKVLLDSCGGGDFLNTVAAFDLWGLA